MKRTLTEDQSVELAKLLIWMEVPEEMLLDIITVIETPQELKYFLDILSENDYEMTPEEVYQASIETVQSFQTLKKTMLGKTSMVFLLLLLYRHSGGRTALMPVMRRRGRLRRGRTKHTARSRTAAVSCRCPPPRRLRRPHKTHTSARECGQRCGKSRRHSLPRGSGTRRFLSLHTQVRCPVPFRSLYYSCYS